MKSLLIAVLPLAAPAAVAASRSPVSTTSQALQTSNGPWQVGQCYRVFPSEVDTLYTFKVLEPAQGTWLRVQPAPTSPTVPGGKPQAALWINLASPFAVQEWSCSG